MLSKSIKFLKLEGLKPEQEQKIEASTLIQPNDLVILPTGYGKVSYTKFCPNSANKLAFYMGRKPRVEKELFCVICCESINRVHKISTS